MNFTRKQRIDAWIRRILICAWLPFAVVAGCRSSITPPPITEITGRTMGTVYHVRLAEPPANIDLKELQGRIDQLLETVNDQMSTYRPDSELSRFNAYGGIDWFEVSSATVTVVDKALEISRLSEGAFDVTVGPLVDLWNFGPDRRSQQIPSQEEIEAARKQLGYKKLETRSSPPGLRKSNPELQIDLSAIAKGFAVDQVARLLDEHDISAYLVEIGGEMRTKGTKPDGSGWKVGIETPTTDRRGLQKILELNNASLATSGDYRNFFEYDGKRYSHTIDPRTGRPIEYRLASVSVIADDCMTADAMATAIMVLGPQEGYNLAVQQDLAVLLLVRAAQGWNELATPLFAKLKTVDNQTP